MPPPADTFDSIGATTSPHSADSSKSDQTLDTALSGSTHDNPLGRPRSVAVLLDAPEPSFDERHFGQHLRDVRWCPVCLRVVVMAWSPA